MVAMTMFWRFILFLPSTYTHAIIHPNHISKETCTRPFVVDTVL